MANIPFLNNAYFAAKVGIGTENPAEKLEVSGTGELSLKINNTQYTRSLTITQGGGYSHLKTSHSSGVAINYGQGNAGILSLFNNTTQSVKINANGSSYFNGGNVGIGTTSPGYKLDVSSGSAVGARISTTGFTNLDLVSTRPSGNLGGLRFKQDIDTYQTGEFLGLHGGGFDWKVGNGTGGNPVIKMRLDSSGNLGIGTTSPSFKLHVDSDVASGDVCFVHHDNPSQSSGTVMKIRSDAGDNAGSALLNIENNTGSALYVRGDRNVGIGTTSPGAKLDIVGSSLGIRVKKADLSDVLRVYTQGSGVFVNNGDFHVEDNVGIGTTSPGQKLDVNGSINASSVVFAEGFYGNRLWNSDNSALRFATNNTERMRITSAGDVGIGTTNPGRQLELRGQGVIRLNAISSGSPGLDFNTSDVNDMQIRYRSTTDALAIYSYGTSSDVLTIKKSDGNVGIGTTGPSQKLHVTGNARVTGAYYDSNNSPGTSGQILSSTVTGTDWVSGSGLPGGPYVPISGGSGSNQAMTGSLWLSSVNPVLFWNDTGAATDKKRRFIQNNDQKFWIARQDDDGSNTVYDFGVSASGNVGIGIGTDNASARLHVKGNDIATRATTTAQSVLRLVRNVADATYPSTKDSAVDFMLSRQQSVNNNLPYTRLDFRLAGTTDSSTPSLDVMSLLHNGNVGIGTTSPTSKLQLKGDSTYLEVRAGDNSQAVQLGADSSGDGLLQLYSDAGIVKIKLYGEAASPSYINAGNVGIGTTSPGAKLDVNGSIRLSTSGKVEGRSYPYTTNIGSGANATTTNITAGSTDKSEISLIGGDVGDRIEFKTNSTERMRITSNGNVGIGTTSPKQKLHVSGGATAGDVTKMVIGATGGNAESYLYLAESFDGDNVNYGFSFVADGNSSNNLLFKRHSNSISGTTVMEIRRGSDQIRFNGYSGTNQTGTPTYILGTTSGGDIVKVLGGDIPGGGGTVTGTGATSQIPLWSDGPNGVLGNSIISQNGTSRISVASSSASLTLGQWDGSNNRIESASRPLFITSYTSPIKLGISGSTTMTIESSNVGIGTTVPRSKFHVSGGDMIIQSSSRYGNIRGNNTDLGYGGAIQTSTSLTNSEKWIALGQAYSGTGAFTPAMTVMADGTGYVGIGTTNPLNKLFVSASTAGDYAGFIENTNSTNGYGLVARTAHTGTSAYAFAARAGTSDIFVVRGDGMVGIGTYRPNEKLQVGGNIHIWDREGGTDGALYVTRGSTNTTFAKISSNGISYLNGGNVGIGTTAPEGILQISKPSSTVYDGTSDTGQSNIGASVTIQNTNTTVNSFAQINMQVSASSNRAVGRVVTIARGNASSDMAFVTESFGVRAEKMRIDQTGHVGIGTTSPGSKLEVSSGAGANGDSILTISADTDNSTSSSSPKILMLQKGSTKTSLIEMDSSNRTHFSNGDGHYFSGGNVGIGTTSPVYKLDVNGGVQAGGKVTYTKSAGSLNTTGYAVAGITALPAGNGSSCGFTFTCFGGVGKYQKLVYSCYNSTGTWNAKKVIDEGTNDLDVVASANGTTITFTFKAKSSTQSFTPRVTVEAVGTSINSTYA